MFGFFDVFFDLHITNPLLCSLSVSCKKSLHLMWRECNPELRNSRMCCSNHGCFVWEVCSLITFLCLGLVASIRGGVPQGFVLGPQFLHKLPCLFSLMCFPVVTSELLDEFGCVVRDFCLNFIFGKTKTLVLFG